MAGRVIISVQNPFNRPCRRFDVCFVVVMASIIEIVSRHFRGRMYFIETDLRVKKESPLLPLRNNSDRTGLCLKHSDMHGMSTCCHLVNRPALRVKISVHNRWAILH